MREKRGLLAKENIEFQNIIGELISNEVVLQMKNFTQHYSTTRFEHCYAAAFYCYLICKKFHLDYVSATRGAMLHDLFLYDWRTNKNRKGLHAFTHGKLACENASNLFDLNAKEKDMIIKHMWPLTFKFPRYRESFILTFVDKYCASIELFNHIRKKFNKSKAKLRTV